MFNEERLDVEIPLVDIPDEMSQPDMNEVEVETPHPVINPLDDETRGKRNSEDNHIGFV